MGGEGPVTGVCRALCRLSRCLGALSLLLAGGVAAQDPRPADYRTDALSIEPLINANYAYLDRFADGHAPVSETLRQEARSVHDADSLLRYAEHALFALADHHAITGRSLRDSWAVVPSCSDLWIDLRGETYVITAVRDGSPAMAAGVRPGDRLTAVADVPVAEAVRAFWTDLGLPVTLERAAFAARVLAAGRRDRARALTFARTGALSLASLYGRRTPDGALTVSREDGTLVIRLHNSLGDDGTIAAFDAAMATAAPGQPVRIDLTDTPSGGNTTVARAILGWFVDAPAGYQVHNLPREERETGIARQWIEQVLPRPGQHHDGPVSVRVGRWTGSMGEGLAVGFHAIGAPVCGDRMAGLRGAVYDLPLEHSGLVLKLPVERLSTVDGVPRERFEAAACVTP